MEQLRSIAVKYGINTFYWFGSYVDGSFNETSDIDLAYLSVRKEKKIDHETLYFDLKEFISKEIDLVDLRNAPLNLAFQIISEGRVLYARDAEARTDLEDEIIRNHLDFGFYTGSCIGK